MMLLLHKFQNDIKEDKHLHYPWELALRLMIPWYPEEYTQHPIIMGLIQDLDSSVPSNIHRSRIDRHQKSNNNLSDHRL